MELPKKAKFVIIGAGIIGMAIAREIAMKGHEVIVLEKHPRAGEETSSRNSGVIHSGIYYPTGSNKATLCVEGNRLLYEYAKKRNIWHRNTGKLVIASTSDEEGKFLNSGDPIPEPEEWFHDILRIDGSPYDEAEVSFIREITEQT